MEEPRPKTGTQEAFDLNQQEIDELQEQAKKAARQHPEQTALALVVIDLAERLRMKSPPFVSNRESGQTDAS